MPSNDFLIEAGTAVLVLLALVYVFSYFISRAWHKAKYVEMSNFARKKRAQAGSEQ